MSDDKRIGAKTDTIDYTIDSVMRALRILNALASADEQTTLSDLSSVAEISTSTAFRLLWNLERAGYAKKGENGYYLGHKVLNLFAAYQRQNNLLASARQYVDRLRDETGETISLITRDKYERVCIYAAESRQSVRRVARIGPLGPLWRGSAGRMLLAFVKPDEVEAMLHNLENAAALRLELEKIRKRGTSVSLYDTSPDVWSVAAPIHFASGEIVAAISCSGPAQRAEKGHMSRCEQLTAAMAAEWSTDLGYTGFPADRAHRANAVQSKPRRYVQGQKVRRKNQ